LTRKRWQYSWKGVLHSLGRNSKNIKKIQKIFYKKTFEHISSLSRAACGVSFHIFLRRIMSLAQSPSNFKSVAHQPVLAF